VLSRICHNLEKLNTYLSINIDVRGLKYAMFNRICYPVDRPLQTLSAFRYTARFCKSSLPVFVCDLKPQTHKQKTLLTIFTFFYVYHRVISQPPGHQDGTSRKLSL